MNEHDREHYHILCHTLLIGRYHMNKLQECDKCALRPYMCNMVCRSSSKSARRMHLKHVIDILRGGKDIEE